MAEEESVDIEQQLKQLLTKVQPNLQDVIKRSFTNVMLQRQTKNGEQSKLDILEDTSYFSKNTQVNLNRLELVKAPMFHVQTLSLDLLSMSLQLRCSLGEVNVRGLYSSFNENLYNLIPVMSEGHVLITLSNMIADVNVGLVLEDDAFSFINPGIDFSHDEVLVKLSWPSPQKSGGYEFTTTEQLAKHIDDLPLTAAISLPLYALLRRRLQSHLSLVLRRATSVSDLMCCNPSLFEAYSAMAESLASNGNRIFDMILINMRRTLLQNRREVLDIPPLHSTFMHKIGSISFMGKFETGVGWVKSLATVNRSGDVSVTRLDDTRTCFRVALRIKDLQMGFEEYRMKAMGVACSGRLAATFVDNELLASVTLGFTKWETFAQLDDLSVTRLDGMDLHITGLGPLSGTSPLISSWTRGAASSLTAPSVSRQLQHELHIALAELPLWDLMHGK